MINRKKTLKIILFFTIILIPLSIIGQNKTQHSHLFRYYAPHANRVSVVGSFNSWNPDKNLMKKNKSGDWFSQVLLEDGIHQYGFIVDDVFNKIGQFLISLPLRNIVGQRENTFDFRTLMDEGKILIVNLSKGKIGEENCALLGAMIVTKIQLAALSRVDLKENNRKPFYLYVDEIHNFLTLSFADILSEARKYGLNLTLAHQYIDQLDEKLRAAIFGNVGTIISFRVGAEDAKYLAKEFSPVFSECDLLNLDNHHIYVKLMIDGKTSKPFSAITLSPFIKSRSFRKEIIKKSREAYSRERKKVEKDVLFRNPSPLKSYDQRKLF